LFDTFRKILAFELKSLLRLVKNKYRNETYYEIARKAHELRIMNNDNIPDKRIDGYITLLDHIASIRTDPKYYK
jgi:hypothetical protein